MRYIKKIYRIMCFFLISIIILTISTKTSYANIKDLTFNNLNMEQGISQCTARCMFQDSKGYIWIGTTDGLNRFNGYEYKVYNYKEGENGITNGTITGITEDNKKNIWATTVNGINKINTTTNKISKYTEENKKIKDNYSTSILKTKDGKILVSTFKGIYIYNEEKDSFDKVLDKKDGILSDTVFSLSEDDYGNIWIGTDLGVNKISKDFKVLETYKSGESKSFLGDSNIYTICCDDKNNSVWVGTSDSGVYIINTKTKKIHKFKSNPHDENSLPSNKIYTILKDDKNNIWIGTDNGLTYYNKEKDNFNTYKNDPTDKNSLVYNEVRSLLEDEYGEIWVGTYSGISLFNTKTIIKNYKNVLNKDYLLAENRVQGVYEDEYGYLWVGSSSKGVSVINLKDQSSKFINTKNTKEMKSDSIKDITGYKNYVFIATDEGILKIDKKTSTIKTYTAKDKLVNNAVNDIFVDDKGYLWVGTIKGLSIIDIKTDEIIDMTPYVGKDKYISSIYQDKEGIYYLGLYKQGGLCCINPKNKTIKYYKNEKNNKKSISSNAVTCINEDNNNNIWIGTIYGVNKFNKKTETFTRYNTENGMLNNTVNGILVGEENNIWVSTNNGISKIDEKDNKIENLTTIDGLQGNEFSSNSCYKTKYNKMYFGGINGLNSFYPKEINHINTKPKVSFDTFEVEGKEYTDINNMKFDVDTNEITIKFFSPVYYTNKNLTYEYELEGLKSSKNKTKNNYVTYNKFCPGKYTFKVSVIDNFGNKSKTQKITFTIKQPFWISKLAISIYIIIILLVAVVHRYQVKKLDRVVNERTRNLKEEMEKNEKLHNKNLALEINKNNYLINLSHELRTPLNVINSTNQVIESLSNNNSLTKEKLNHYIGLSQKNCKRLLGLINDILDNSKLQNNKYDINLKETDIVYLVEETALTLIEYTKSKGIDLIIDPLIEEKTIKCDSHEIERCVVNLISNAIKFTPRGGRITVGVEDLDDKVKINVQDTGIGIDKKFHKTIFNRFNQVSENEIIKGGSGLGLTITSQIVKLHNGEIYVESELGKGSNFVIILPTDPEHIKENAIT